MTGLGMLPFDDPAKQVTRSDPLTLHVEIERTSCAALAQNRVQLGVGSYSVHPSPFD